MIQEYKTYSKADILNKFLSNGHHLNPAALKYIQNYL
jgi:hypothetical protein